MEIQRQGNPDCIVFFSEYDAHIDKVMCDWVVTNMEKKTFSLKGQVDVTHL